jgi:ParB family chromosome partitioning protein
MLPLDAIHPFKNHPFRIVDDEEMQKTAESIREYGVLVPAIVRPLENGEYEMISGHRRRYASMLAGKETMPVIVREMDDDTATILMVDSNLQREHILPSERAKAYQMKQEALRHQGQRTDLTLGQNVPKFKRTTEEIADGTGQSYKQIQRFIRLNNLIPEIMDMVDEKKIAFNPAVELSYLKPEEQREFLEAMDYAQTTPSVSQAQRIKKLSQQGQSSLEAMCEVMDEVKKPPDDKLVIKSDVLRKYFPKSYTPQQMEAVIMKLLEQWMKKRSREQER